MKLVIPDKSVPVMWVREIGADDPQPMLVNVSDFDAARHAALDEDGAVITDTDDPPTPPKRRR